MLIIVMNSFKRNSSKNTACNLGKLFKHLGHHFFHYFTWNLVLLSLEFV